MEKQELETRFQELKSALEQSTAMHNALIGKGLEIEHLLTQLPDQKEFLDTRLAVLKEEQGQSIANYNALVGRIKEIEFMLDKLVSPESE